MRNSKRGFHRKREDFFRSKLVLNSNKSKIAFLFIVFMFGVVIVFAGMDVLGNRDKVGVGLSPDNIKTDIINPEISSQKFQTRINNNLIPSNEKSDLLVKKQEWQDFTNKYDNKWDVRWNTETQTPAKLIGSGIKSSDFSVSVVTKENIDNLARNFIRTNKALLKIEDSNLRVSKKQESGNLNIVSYQQYYNNIPVFGRFVTLATKNNKIVLFKSNYRDDFSITITPQISELNAEKFAKDFFDIGNNIKSESVNLVIYPSEKNHLLSYEIDFPLVKNPDSELDKPYIKPTMFVDAQNGAIIDYYDNIEYETLSGSVSGMIYPKFSNELQIEKPFVYEWINANGLQGTTNELGYYEIENLNGNVNLNANLEGPWANVFNEQQERAVRSASFSVPAIHNWNWKDFDNSYKQEESNVFYHTNVIHDYITKPSLNVSEMNLQMEVNVNLPYSCNAFYDGSSINFFMAGGGCESSALDAGVIYHEYGHGINRGLVEVEGVYWPYQCETGNMNEGMADYWACTIKNESCSSYFYYGECGRPCENIEKFPTNYNCEPHSGAQIISGSFWDLRKIYGIDYVDNLAIEALRLQPMSFSELLENVLIVDDDNENLNDGTPHINDICHSFWDNHGIFSEYCLGHTLIPVAIITTPSYLSNSHIFKKGGIIMINGTIYGTITSPIDSYTLEYASDTEPSVWLDEGIITTGGTEIVNDFLGQLNTSLLLEGAYKLRISADYNGGIKEYSTPVTIFIDDKLREGWPITVQDIGVSSPLLGDLDKDGYDDVIIDAHNYLQVLDRNGITLLGWEHPDLWWGSGVKPAIGDIDGDSNNEVIWGSEHGEVTAYHHDGENVWLFCQEGNRNLCGLYAIGSPIIVNDINSDGSLEVIFGSYDHYLYVLNGYGSLLWKSETIFEIQSSPSIGDLDNDGDKEIVINVFNRKTGNYLIYIFNKDGSYFINPLSVELIDPTLSRPYRKESSPALADLDNDGHLEIILGLPDGSLGVWKYTGVPLWRNYFSTYDKRVRSPAIGDVDYDGDLEIFVTNGISIYAFNHDGSQLDNWPQQTISEFGLFEAPPVLFDLNGDNLLEVIVTRFRKLLVFEYNGTQIYKNSFNIPGLSHGAVAVGDLDNNGKPDLVLGVREEVGGKIFAWELDTQLGTINRGWSELQYDNKNTGCYDCDKLEFCPSGHTDNHNGTCTINITSITEDGNVFNESGWKKNTSDVYLNMGKRVGTNWIVHRSYIEWNISLIPDTATIQDTHFLHSGGFQIDSQIWDITSRPSMSTPQSIYTDAGTGKEYATPNAFPQLGGQDVNIGVLADADLQTKLLGDWFAIGFKSIDETAGSASWVNSKESTITPKPTLIVTYTPKPICGNSILELGEQCDDSNTINGDGCSSSCQIETSQCSSGADTDGNNIIDNNELNIFIQEYYLGNMNIDKLSNAIKEHLNGCG